MRKAFALLIAVFFILGGCVVNEKPQQEEKPAAVDREPAADKPVQAEEPAREPEEPPALEEPVVPEEPSAPEEPAAPDADTESLAYLTAIEPVLTQLSEGLLMFGQLNIEASGDPSLLTDSRWVAEMAESLLMMEGASKELKGIDAPPQMEEAHHYLLLAGEEIAYVVENYPEAIDTMDIVGIEQCTEALLNAGVYLDKAAVLLGGAPPSY
ncbi:hypothetical protein ACQCVE_06200 [Metabacillus sp. 113a]|uniref:hypothetical protein n=1 Tax=Metabacillus sp. 113a TaxID=3404706 RepID=UPI003CEB9DD2